MPIEADDRPGTDLADFRPIKDETAAAEALMKHAAKWNHFLVMNRTFYKLPPALCAYLAKWGQVYGDAESGSIIVLGARFMPWQALHIGLFVGDADLCLNFARQKGVELGVKQLNCMFPASADETKDKLHDGWFECSQHQFIVMKKSI